MPVAIRVLFLLATFGLTFYCIVTDAGPYALIADAQAAVMHGEHYLMLSGLLTLLVFLVPTIVVLQLLALLFKGPTPPTPPMPPPYQGF